MAKNEKSGPEVASIAARLLKHPGQATKKEIKALAASVLTQVSDQPKPADEPKAADQPKPVKQSKVAEPPKPTKPSKPAEQPKPGKKPAKKKS